MNANPEIPVALPVMIGGILVPEMKPNRFQVNKKSVSVIISTHFFNIHIQREILRVIS